MFLLQTAHTCECMRMCEKTLYIKGTPQSLFSPLVEIDVTGNVPECEVVIDVATGGSLFS